MEYKTNHELHYNCHLTSGYLWCLHAGLRTKRKIIYIGHIYSLKFHVQKCLPVFLSLVVSLVANADGISDGLQRFNLLVHH